MNVRLPRITDRHLSIASAAAVTGAAAAISYHAELGIAHHIGIPDPLAYLFPLCIDGVAGVAMVALRTIPAARGADRAQVWAILLLAALVSTLANGADAAAGGLPLPLVGLTTNALWSTVPAVGYAIALHVLGLLHAPAAPASTRSARSALPPERADRPKRRHAPARGWRTPRVMRNGVEMSAAHARKLDAASARAQGGSADAAAA